MILIDDRAGSAPRTVTRTSPRTGHKYTKHYPGLIDYYPLNTCRTCAANDKVVSTLTYRKTNDVSTRVCPINPDHKPLAEICRLDAGDVCFTGNGPDSHTVSIGVEVKSISDLVSSLYTHRLQGDQIPRMIKGEHRYDVSWILYYGLYRVSPRDGITLQTGRAKETGEEESASRNMVYTSSIQWKDESIGSSKLVPFGYVASFLLSPSFTSLSSLGMHAAHVCSMADAAAWIGCLYRTWQKPYRNHKSMHVLHTPTSRESATAVSRLVSSMPPDPDGGSDDTAYVNGDPDLNQRALTAASWPGIRYERGMAAAKHFASIYDMTHADESEWARIPGFGKVLAKSVVATIRKRAKGKNVTKIAKIAETGASVARAAPVAFDTSDAPNSDFETLRRIAIESARGETRDRKK